jgi:hypothetical protein
MRKFLLILCLFCSSLYAFETDFDVVVVGSSPFSLFEAIYKRCLGQRVVVLEQAPECGGAWKSITICGIDHVDLGCHEFGISSKIQNFLEEYGGCKTVALPPPPQVPGREKPRPMLNEEQGRFYPSRGCYEFNHNLELLMQKLGVVLMLNTKLESVFVDADRNLAEVAFNGMRYTTKKLVVTNNSEIKIENPQVQEMQAHNRTHCFPHLYILIADPTPPRFNYQNMHMRDAFRAMNGTEFIDLEKGKQLISIQVRNQQHLEDPEKYLMEFKKYRLVDPSAYILKTETYIYKQTPFNQLMLHKLGKEAQSIFEILDSGGILNLAKYIDKWKTAMKPWNEAMEVK